MDDQNNGWASIIDTVRRPLSFFTLALLVLYAIVVGIPPARNSIPQWVPLGVLVLIILLVFIIIMTKHDGSSSTKDQKPDALDPKDSQQGINNPPQTTIKVKFPGKFDSSKIDTDKCHLFIYEDAGRLQKKFAPAYDELSGALRFTLPENLLRPVPIRLEMTDGNGDIWKTHSFYPHETTVDAKLQ